MSEQRVPVQLEIGKSLYTIHFMRRMPQKGVVGLCDPEDKIIYVSLRQPSEQIQATLWHEILHAIEVEYGVKLGHPKINRLEWALAQVMSQF